MRGARGTSLNLHPLQRSFLLWLVGICLFWLPSICRAETGSLNINTATVAELQELPFVGHERAKAIVRYRKTHGPFSNLDELKQIPDIGTSTYEAITPYVTTSGSTKSFSKTTPPLPTAKIRPLIHTTPGEIILLPNGEYYDSLLSAVHNAKHRIDITMFLFKTTKSPKNRPALLLKEIIAARKRGVNIHVILDKSDYDEKINKENTKVVRILKRNGIDVRLDSEKRTTHAKIVVVDMQLCFVGSHNLTHSALAYNNEFSMLINSKVLAKELLNYMQEIQ